MQSLAEREHVELLPTAASNTAGEFLLNQEILSATTSPESYGTPATANGRNEPNEKQISGATSRSGPGDQYVEQEPSQAAVEPTSAAPPEEKPTPAPTSRPLIPTSSRLHPFKHHFQTWNNCGPATLAMGLSFFDLALRQEQIAATLKPNPEDRNVSPHEIADYVNNETDLSAINRVNGDLETLKQFVANGYPVIVELGLDPPGEYRWMGWYGHYLLVVAYDDASEEFWVYDSWFGTSEVPVENADVNGRQVSYVELDNYWRQFNRNYIVLFRPSQESDVERIIGPDIDDSIMWNRALTAAQNELEIEPENAFLWFNLGMTYNELKDYERSAAAFDQAREIGLPWRMLWYQFGPYQAYYNVERYSDILILADVTLMDRPYFEESYYYKGLALAALGEDREARSNLEEAVNFNPNFVPAQAALDQLERSG
jgi:tetratricopeptide (TPR) repeat protein